MGGREEGGGGGHLNAHNHEKLFDDDGDSEMGMGQRGEMTTTFDPTDIRMFHLHPGWVG